MADWKHNAAATLESPAWDAAAVTPADGADLPKIPTAGLYVGSAGNVVVHMASGDTSITFTGVPAGTVLPIRVDRVLATSTTASNIVALYHA